jgi:hypothetical protein
MKKIDVADAPVPGGVSYLEIPANPSEDNDTTLVPGGVQHVEVHHETADEISTDR